MAIKLKHDSVIIDYMRFTIPYDFEFVDKILSHKDSYINRVNLNKSPWEYVLDVIHALHLNYTGDADSIQNVVKSYSTNGYDKQINFGDIILKFKLLDSRQADVFQMTDNLQDKDGNEYTNLTIQNNADMGINVEMSGSACREFERVLRMKRMTLLDAIKELKQKYPRMRFGRVDLARDVKDKIPGVTPLAFYRLCANSEHVVKSRSHQWVYYSSGFLETGSHGDTMTLGVRSSDFYVRIYDKAKERYYVHGDTWIDPQSFWIRWEFEIKHALADEIINRFVEYDDMHGIYELYLDLLSTKIFVNPTSKQLAKGQFETVEREVGYGSNKHIRKDKVPIWFYEFTHPIDRTRVVCSKPAKPDKVGTDLVDIQGPGAFFKKLYIHVASHGNPLKLIAHWIKQGKMKQNSPDFKAIMNELKSLDYNPYVIDNLFTQELAYKTIFDVDKYSSDNFTSEAEAVQDMELKLKVHKDTKYRTGLLNYKIPD